MIALVDHDAASIASLGSNSLTMALLSCNASTIASLNHNASKIASLGINASMMAPVGRHASPWLQERWQEVVLLGMVSKVHLPCCWYQVLLGLRYKKQPDSSQRQGVHLGGVLVEILQWWGVGLWFQVRELEDSHGQMLPS